jgi:hypothetical protein
MKGVKYVWRQQLSEARHGWARALLWRAASRFDMVVLDLGVFRLADRTAASANRNRSI